MFSNEAFAQTAEKYMDTVFRVAYGWLKNPDDANDVTQDVLVELYKTDKVFESDTHLKNGSSVSPSIAARCSFAHRGADTRTSTTTLKRCPSSSRGTENCSKP